MFLTACYPQSSIMMFDNIVKSSPGIAAEFG